MHPCTLCIQYKWYTFVPQNLLEQFRRLANWYFLLVILLNYILNVFGKEVAAFPLSFVLLCTAIKDLFEDSTRRRCVECICCLG